ncbi:unnamed protein product [Acanthoscelides obtectus]|uniref:Uncharacterized protein n=1 Tax=Acanthoscelides obtectus TaxID=200917 RepID=A0A9P0PBY5_ACAOB|nr:unnamed protein product [Acanthoscelides obtectus]CAK1646968.1 hypothetical protein AOBTE_LOCUS14975 [Acanthoscelides obtectus]
MENNEGQRSGSLDSLNKLVNEDGRSGPSPPLRGWRPVRPPNIPPQRPPRTRHITSVEHDDEAVRRETKRKTFPLNYRHRRHPVRGRIPRKITPKEVPFG